VMERFQRTGTGSGVGLAGIRERMKELGGDFTICSSGSGTTLRSAVPLGKDTKQPSVRSLPELENVPVSPTEPGKLATNIGRAS